MVEGAGIMQGKPTGTKLRPIHHSVRSRTSGLRPHNMEKIVMPHEMTYGLTDIALSIFVDCCNSGRPMQEAILAVYLSGLQHGHAIMSEKNGN